jgi:hypothetical protein
MIRPLIARVRLVTMTSEVDARTIASEFPTLKIERAHAARVDDAIIDADEWRKATTFAPFDETLARSRGDALMVRGDRHVELVACEALTRYQRFVQRRNGSSRTRVFEQILKAHRALCEPLATNEFDQALDTWQWMLRLDPAATLTAQLAALFYVSLAEPAADTTSTTDNVLATPETTPEVGARVPLHSETYLRASPPVVDEYGNPITREPDLVTMPAPPPLPRESTARPAKRTWTLEALAAAGVEESIAARVGEIVSLQERRGRDTEMDLLSDAAALSFLSLGSPAYLDTFGPEHTRQKLVNTLGQMGDVARTKLSLVRLRPDVRTLFQRAVAA